MSEIVINDLVEELSEDNKRLAKELAFERQLTQMLDKMRQNLLDVRIKCVCNQNINTFELTDQLDNHYRQLVSQRDISEDNVSTKTEELTKSDKQLETTIGPKKTIILNKGLLEGIRSQFSVIMGSKVVSKTNVDLNIQSIISTNTSGSVISQPLQRQQQDLPSNTVTIEPKPCGSTKMVTNFRTRSADIIDLNDNIKCFNASSAPKIELKKILLTKDGIKVVSNATNTTPLKISSHSKTIHNVNSIHECNIKSCSAMFGTQHAYNGDVDQLQPNYDCIYCGQTFMNNKMYYKHKITIHETNKLFRCQVTGCHYSCVFKSGMKSHTDRHNNHRPYVCPQSSCGKRFVSRGKLNGHHREYHSGRELLKCNYTDCNKQFRCQSDLNKHKRVAHRYIGKQFPCKVDGCNGHFKSPLTLRSHMRQIHECPHKYQCHWPGCDYKAYTQFQVNNHARVHSQDKPYACQWPGCDYRCRFNAGIRSHTQLIHNIDKPYTCDWPDCGQRFKTKACIRQHMSVHSGVEIGCDWTDCQFKTKWTSALRTHKRLVHKCN